MTIWNDAAVAVLRAEWPATRVLTIADKIAEATGIRPNKNAIIGKAHRLGLGTHVAKIPRTKAPRPPRLIRSRPLNPNAKPPRPEVPRLEDSQIPPEQRLTLLQLTANTCRYPVGDPTDENFFFCGGVALDHSYCPAHRQITERPR
ncbi:MAG: GcrA family cell cycle regulator [Sphingobacteriales bacterium]